MDRSSTQFICAICLCGARKRHHKNGLGLVLVQKPCNLLMRLVLTDAFWDRTDILVCLASVYWGAPVGAVACHWAAWQAWVNKGLFPDMLWRAWLRCV